MLRRLVCALVLVIAGGARAQTPAAQPKVSVKKLAPLTLGLTGYTGAEAARADSEALQSYLAQRAGRDVLTRVYADGDQLAQALASGQIDLAWMQPFTVVAAQKQGKVVPVVKAVRHGLPFYRGVLFTKADAKIGAPKQLQGRTVAWVSKTSAAGYLFPRASLVQAGLQPAKLFKAESFAGDHLAVCRAVLDGKADVGATFADDRPKGEPAQVDGCVQQLGAEEAKGLRIVASSAPIPNDAIVARPGLSADELGRMKSLFLRAKDDADGKLVLLGVFKAEGFVEVGDADFEPVRFAAESAAK